MPEVAALVAPDQWALFVAIVLFWAVAMIVRYTP